MNLAGTRASEIRAKTAFHARGGSPPDSPSCDPLPLLRWELFCGSASTSLARQHCLLFFCATNAASSSRARPQHCLTLLCARLGCIHFRVPLGLGGAYMTFSLLASWASMFVAIHLYNGHAPDVTDDGVEKMPAVTLWTVAGGLFGLWLATAVYFVARIATPSHRRTLWSVETGFEHAQAKFLTESNSDAVKFCIFGFNPRIWESDIGDRVEEWTKENWARFEVEKPLWFCAYPSTVPRKLQPHPLTSHA